MPSVADDVVPIGEAGTHSAFAVRSQNAKETCVTPDPLSALEAPMRTPLATILPSSEAASVAGGRGGGGGAGAVGLQVERRARGVRAVADRRAVRRGDGDRRDVRALVRE